MDLTWQPIETAPKDGTKVLICARWKGGGELAVARWLTSEGDPLGAWDSGFATTYHAEVVTHWMPLPEPPT